MQTDGFCLKRYYRDISQKPLLSSTEEREASRLAKKGDPEARRKLIEANLRFVVKMAIPYCNHGLSLEDLIQEGNLGLLEGIERFDPEKGFRLTTYVSWWIRLAIQRAIEQKSLPVRLPANKLEQIRKVDSGSKRLHALAQYSRHWTHPDPRINETLQLVGVVLGLIHLRLPALAEKINARLGNLPPTPSLWSEQ